jgi:hypothetical protein
VKLAALFAKGESLKVVLPEDPVAFWDLEVASSDLFWHQYRDLMWECANYIARTPGVTDVPYEGGEVIPVCGSLAADDLQTIVLRWWDEALSRPPDA